MGISLFLQGILKIIAGIFWFLWESICWVFFRDAAFYPTDPTVSGWQGKPEKGWQPTAFYSRDVERAYAVRTAAVDADCSAGFGKSAGGCFFYVYVQSWNGTTDAGTGLVVSLLGKRFTKRVMEIGAVLVVVLGLAMLSQGFSLSGLLDGTAGSQVEETRVRLDRIWELNRCLNRLPHPNRRRSRRRKRMFRLCRVP